MKSCFEQRATSKVSSQKMAIMIAKSQPNRPTCVMNACFVAERSSSSLSVITPRTTGKKTEASCTNCAVHILNGLESMEVKTSSLAESSFDVSGNKKSRLCSAKTTHQITFVACFKILTVNDQSCLNGASQACNTCF